MPAGAALPEAPVGATPPREPVSPLPHPAAEARRPTNRLYGWLLLALLVAVAAIRLVHLEADAPHELSYQSLADYTDEGYKTFHARNRVLFGSWLWNPADQYTYWIDHSPASLWLHTAWFTACGRVDLPTVRLLHVLLGLLALGLWTATVRREAGDRIALLSTALLGFSYSGAMYGRMAFLENILGVAYSLLLWLLCRARLRLYHLVAGLAVVALAMLVKVTAALFLLGVGCGAVLLGLRWWLTRPRPDRAARSAVEPRRIALRRFLLGMAAAGLACYLVLLFVPGLQHVLLPRAGGSSLSDGSGVLRNLAYVQFCCREPFLFALGLWGAWSALRVAVVPARSASRLSVLCATWLLGGFLVLSLFDGSADRIRYYLGLLPPMSLLAATLLVDHWPARSGAKPLAPPLPPLCWLGRGLWLLAAALTVVNLAVGVYHQLTSENERIQLLRAMRAWPSIQQIPTAFWLPLLGAFMLHVLLGLTAWAWRRGIRWPVVAALGAGALATDGVQLGRWLCQPDYSMQRVRQDLVRRLPADAVLAGQWAPALVLGTPFRGLHLHFNVNLRNDRLRLLGPTHLLRLDGRAEENDLLDQLYPGLLCPSDELAVYHVHNWVLRLYALDWSKVRPPMAGAQGS